METGKQLKVSSDRLVKPEIEHVTPRLQGDEFINYTTAAPAQWLHLRMDLRVPVNCHGHVEMVN